MRDSFQNPSKTPSKLRFAIERIIMACPVCRSELRGTERTEGVCSACGKETTVFHKCVNGHVLCPSCAEALVRQAIRDVCLSFDSRDPRQVLDSMLAVPLISARPLKHHLAVACALATAYCNSSQNDRDLPALLEEVMERGDAIPNGSCWRLGGCGAVLSCGAFLSAVCDVRHDDPEGWGLVHRLTGSCFSAIGGIGGPRCCDRSANVSMRMTVDAVRERLGVDMQWSDPFCAHHQGNNLCLGSACPFNPGRE